MSSITLHGRSYSLPTQPTVVICIDGFDPSYLSHGVQSGILPTMASWLQRGFHKTATCAMPSLTNPNNLSIITGQPTAVHGISGNYYLDPTTGKEVMVTDASTMQGETILERMSRAGILIAAITAKDKLRRIINHGLDSQVDGAICFSSQFADQCTLLENGIEAVETWLAQKTPEQYSGELSLFVLDAGLKLLQEGRADLFYLTLSDFIQHKYAADEPEAEAFMQAIDSRLAEFEKLGAVVAVTGDHGMSSKSHPSTGKPNVLFLEDVLNSRWPESGARVICPIADPFVKHHGALGGFVRVHMLGKASKADIQDMLAEIQGLPEVEMALTGVEAAKKFEMPEKMEGELVVIARKNAVIGSREDEHDLSGLEGHRLRSHGGLSEQEIPILRSRGVPEGCEIKVDGWRNFDVFDLALNY